MRNIFDKNFRLHPLTQGSIISNCIANEFPGTEVSGLVITPRCDLGHGVKVSTIHYLPVVSLKQWMEKNGKEELKKEVLRKLKDRIDAGISKKAKIEKGYMDTVMATRENVEKILLSDKNSAEKYKNDIKLYFSPTDAEIKDYLKKNSGLTNNLRERIAGKHTTQYYLIEDWKTAGEYQIILLREIHQLSRDTAIRLSKGFFSNEVNQEFFRHNSLRPPKDGEDYIPYEILAELKSPFIEHVMQSYSYHFTRIGVEDRDEVDLVEFL